MKLKCITECLAKLKASLQKSCKPLYKILYTKHDEHRALKRTVSFFYGFFLGIVFYELILVDLNFTPFAALLIGLVITLMLCVGIMLSSQIRCISILAVPNFAGQAGRGVLKSLVFAYLLSGPVENLTINGKEVVRVFGCTTSLTYNLTKTRYELMFKPFSDALMMMKADVSEVKDTIRSIRDVSAPIAGEVEGEEEMRKLKEQNDYLDDVQGDTKQSKELEQKFKTKGEAIEAKRFEKKYLQKIEARCQNLFTKAAEKCRQMFKKAYEICYSTVSWVAGWLLCWPMKITFICNIAEAIGGMGRCDPAKHIDSGFGEGYSYLRTSRDTLSKNFKSVKMQFKIGKVKDLVDLRDATDTAKAIIHEVDSKKSMLKEILIICKRLLAFVFLRIILNSQKYHDRYLRDIEFDNLYITGYFRRIDARRRASERHTLLPLKKIERLKLIDPWSLRMMKGEKKLILPQILKLSLEMVTATTIVLLDRLFYEALDLVRRHAKVEYYQTGKHDMMLQVKGTGMIAGLLRSIVRGFNVKKRIKMVRSNEACLPRPSLMSNYYLYKIYVTYFVVVLFIVVNTYSSRLERPICGYFYRKREKKRVLFLYNQTLKRRIGFFRHMKKKVKKMAREQRLDEHLNVCAVLRVRYPKRCKWLQMFKAARRKCIICGDPEPRKKSNVAGDFEKCKTPNCFVVHCLECWNDMGRQCFACTESDSDSGEDSDEDHYDND